jgi:hypothetical protein
MGATGGRVRYITLSAVTAGCVVIAGIGTGTASGDVGHAMSPKASAIRLAGIDPTSKAAVNRAYLRDYAPNITIAVHWTGSNKGCHAGRISPKARHGTLQSLNFARALAQLGPVAFQAKLSAQDQQAALIMSANDSLSHYPPKSWKCWSKAGSNAAGHSDLALGFPSLNVGQTMDGYLSDPGASNVFAGHRRWLLYPPATTFGDGATSTTNALWVVGPTSVAQPEPAWVPWPTAGWFPNPLEPGGRWSLSASDTSTDFHHARVRMVSAAGKVVHVHRYPVEDGYGDPTVVWHAENVRADGHYRVTVSNIRDGSHKGAFSYSYRVELFTPKRPG